MKPPSWRTPVRLLVSIVAASLLVGSASLSASALAITASSGAQTAANLAASPVKTSLAGFNAGNLIDDGVFFNAATMTEADIQRFLEQKVPACRSGYTCLRDARDTSRSTAGDAMCGPYAGAANEPASRIIYRVAQACGINPQVILVTLQKEQGLVTHTWPSDWRYTIAMGQGCPDTAACDSRYYGFFNQVYGAAWQFKRYGNPPGTSQYFTWYAPGKTWNIQFNPDRGCGSSPVFVENQATANLYYYTPYQPNAAALAAGYGEGDGCSAHGNRNFYNYFTDWFGTVRGSGIVLARAQNNPAVYLLSSGKRWHVVDGGDYQSLSGTLGTTFVVSDAYLASFTDQGTTSAILRDQSTGEISLFQNGQRHRFASCDLVWRWNGDCNAVATIATATFRAVPSGAEMTSYYRVRDSSQWGRIEASRALTPMWNEAAARSANGAPDSSMYAAFANPTLIAVRPKDPMLFAPAQLVKSSASDRVYLTVDSNALRWVSSWDSVAEFNRTPSSLAVIGAAELSARYTEVGTVQPTIRCDSTVYYPASGYLHAVSDPARSGLPSFDAGAATCAQFSRGAAVTGVPLIKKANDASVAAVENGTRRTVASWSALVRYQNGSPITVLTVRQATYDGVATGVPIADGEIVKGSGPALWLVSGTTRVAVSSYAYARDAGLTMSFITLPDADLSKLPQAEATVGHWLACGGVTYFAGGGALRSVRAQAVTGFTVVQLSEAACGRFSVRDDRLQKVVIKSATDDAVYVADAGTYRHAQTWEALTRSAGDNPTILTLSAETVTALPKGSPLR